MSDDPRGEFVLPAWARGGSLRQLRAKRGGRAASSFVTPIAACLAWPGRLSLLVSQPKWGKSTYMAAAVAAVSRGSAWLGESTTRTRIVWLGEESEDFFDARAAELGADPDRVVFVAMPDSAERVVELVEAVEPGLVVVDTLQSLARDAESGSAAAWSRVIRPLADLAHERGLSVVASHHGRRSDGKYRDSGEIAAACDWIGTMSKRPSGVREIKFESRFGIGSYHVRRVGNDWERIGAGELEAISTAPEATRDAVLRFLATQTGPATANAIRSAIGKNRDATLKALSTLAAEGLILDSGTARSHAYVLAEGAVGEGLDVESDLGDEEALEL